MLILQLLQRELGAVREYGTVLLLRPGLQGPQVVRHLPEIRIELLHARQVVCNHSLSFFPALFSLDAVPGVSSAFSRSYSSIASTTMTGRPCFATATGSAQARSISRPKPYFASFALRVCMRLANLAQDQCILDSGGLPKLESSRWRGAALRPPAQECRQEGTENSGRRG
jgi:hypothetical protein